MSVRTVLSSSVATVLSCALAACSSTAAPPAPLAATRLPAQTTTAASYLAIAAGAPALTVRTGTNSFSCALTIATADPNAALPYSDLLAYAVSPNNQFPIYKYPATSAVSWSVPDRSSAITPLYNNGLPGQTIWPSTPATQTQTHCMTLTIVVPATTAVGTYPVSITYVVGVGAGPSGLRFTAASQTVTLDFVVTRS
jgi:hypothetical protein